MTQLSNNPGTLNAELEQAYTHLREHEEIHTKLVKYIDLYSRDIAAADVSYLSIVEYTLTALKCLRELIPTTTTGKDVCEPDKDSLPREEE